MPDVAPDGQFAAENAALRAENAELRAENAALRAGHEELERVLRSLTERVVELERRLASDSSNSSRPPSLDPPWSKKPARKRSSRTSSGRKPGKQPGSSSSSRSLIDNANDTLEIQPDRCRRCDASLAGARECGRQRRQVVDVRPAPPPKVTEYQRISKVCRCCGAVTTPGWDDEAVPLVRAALADPAVLAVIDKELAADRAARRIRSQARRVVSEHAARERELDRELRSLQAAKSVYEATVKAELDVNKATQLLHAIGAMRDDLPQFERIRAAVKELMVEGADLLAASDPVTDPEDAPFIVDGEVWQNGPARAALSSSNQEFWPRDGRVVIEIVDDDPS